MEECFNNFSTPTSSPSPLNDNCSIFVEEKNQDVTYPLHDNSYDYSFDKLSFLANASIKQKETCLVKTTLLIKKNYLLLMKINLFLLIIQ